MRIPENIRKCVAYVSYAMVDGTLRPAGSVFFVGRVKEGSSTADRVYAVTAKHVIEGIKGLGLNEVILRMNLKEGTPPIGIAKSSTADWFTHPTDNSIDVAIREMGIPTQCDHQVIPMNLFLSPQLMEKNEVGLGEEVFITGLFRHHVGTGKNIPIIRVGNLSAFDEEPISTYAYGDMNAYLVEARSIGGLSGSPVFLNLGFVRSIEGQVKHLNSKDPMFFLLGIIHGHYDAKASEIDAGDNAEQQEISEKINTGIAIVTPYYAIQSVIDEYEKAGKSL